MQRSLHISDDLSLPLDAVTQTFVIYGGKGMGKTNCGSVLAEELAAAGRKFSVIDPLGVWFGLRHSADGKGPGVEVLMLGGAHADIPIEPIGGAVIADLVVDEDVNTIVDISRHPNGKMWSMGERIRFVADYCTQLFQRQGEKKHAMMQIIDEAGRFCPQSIPSGAQDIAKCVGAIEQLVEWGRNIGVGVTLITQRSARMNKSVSELADSMFAFRTIGPNSVGAVIDWFGEHVPKERQRELVERLRKLPRGTALVVSPGWLDVERETQIRLRTTFDSSKTPTAGQSVRRIGPAAKPDLTKYQTLMAQAIERARENDPKNLRSEISRLKSELQKAAKARPLPAVIVKPDKAWLPPKLPARQMATCRTLVSQVERAVEKFSKATKPLLDQLVSASELANTASAAALAAKNNLLTSMQALSASASLPAPPASGIRIGPSVQKLLEKPPEFPVTADASRQAMVEVAGEARSLSKCARKILEVLSQLPDGGKINKLALLSGYAVSGGFRNALTELRKCGFMAGENTATMSITQAGWTQSPFPVLPSGAELREHWLKSSVFSKCAKEVLKVLLDHRVGLSIEALASLAGYEVSGGFRNALTELRTGGVMIGKNTETMRASDELLGARVTADDEAQAA